MLICLDGWAPGIINPDINVNKINSFIARTIWNSQRYSRSEPVVFFQTIN